MNIPLYIIAIFGALSALLSNVATATEPFSYHGWSNACRLSNDSVEVIVIPAIGRIMRYSLLGGPNLLRENPKLDGIIDSPVPYHWRNFGGDGVLPWPQRDWPDKLGHDWPPPAGFAPQQFEVQTQTNLDLRMISQPVEPFNFRIIREIHLAPHGTKLTTTTHFEQVRPSQWTSPIAVWSITQWEGPEMILALVETTAAQPTTPMFGVFGNIKHESNLIKIQPPTHESAKLGIDSNELAAVIGDNLVVQHAVCPEHNPRWKPGDRAQTYCSKEPEKTKPDYVELEFTSPLHFMKVGEQMSLEVDWEIHPLTPSHKSGAELGRLLNDH